MDSELIEASSRLFLTLVRQRFHGKNQDTYHKFIALLEKHVCNASSGSIQLMFTEVQTLFGSDQYLINKFATFVENYRNIKISSSDDDEEVITPLSRNQQLIKNSVDLLNNVSRTLKDQEQFNRFIDVVAGFRKSKVNQRVETVRKRAYKVLKRHPLLIKEWSVFLAEAKAEKPKKSEAKVEMEKVDVGDISEPEANVVYKSTAENYHEYMFDYEHAMHKIDLLYHRALSVKDSAKRLISENTDKDPTEKIDVAVYFNAMNVKYVKKELKGCRQVLLNKSKLRGKAVRVAKRILNCADKKIEKMKYWSQDKKNMALKGHEEDNQIPVFDWYNDDEDEEAPKFDWLP